MFRIGAVALAVALLASAPTVGAQEPLGPVEITFGVPGDDEIEVLVPETGLVGVPITVVFAIPAGHVCTKTLESTFGVSGPAYATPHISPPGRSWTLQEEPTVFASNGGVNETVEVYLFVSTTRKAPAMTVGEYTVWANLTVESSEPDCTIEGASASTVLRVTNGYFPLIEVLPHRTQVMVQPGETFQFRLNLTNYGNVETVVTVVADSLEEALSFEDRAPVTLASPHKDTEHEFAEVTYLINGSTSPEALYTNSVLFFLVTVTGEYGGPEDAGPAAAIDPYRRQFSVHVMGAQAPAAEAFFVVAALAVGAVLARRKLP